MNTRTMIKTLLVVFVIMFSALAVFFVCNVSLYGQRWFSSPYNTRVRSAKTSITAGTIMDCGGKNVAYTNDDGQRTYSENRTTRRAVAHVVGDNYGQTTGAESTFAKYLLGFDESVFERMSHLGQKRRGEDITLTVDTDLSTYAYELLDGRNGAVILMNYKTGAVIVSTCYPSFDTERIPGYISGELSLTDGAMVNRVTMGRYTPGSVFKLVTTIAALRYIDNVENMEFDCSGELIFDYNTGKYIGTSKEIDTSTLTQKYVTVSDFEHSEHGVINLETAFQKSCNSVFARLAIMIGAEKIAKTAKKLGLTENAVFNDMVAYSGSFQQGQTDYELAWSGVGQYKDLVTPLNMCMLTSAVANNGIMQEPRLLNSVISPSGSIRYSFTPNVYKSALSAQEAETLRRYMFGCVESGTGKKCKIDGYKVGGKTGTAEITIGDENRSHAWFTGFLYSEQFPYAVTVIVECGGGGGSVAAPVAKKVLSAAIKRG